MPLLAAEVPLTLTAAREAGWVPFVVTNGARTQQEIKFGAMAAVGVVTAVPIILLAVFANRQIVAGLTRGAVKG